MHPEDPIYLANLAEDHDKLGTEAALRFAKEALMRKADSAICRGILARSFLAP